MKKKTVSLVVILCLVMSVQTLAGNLEPSAPPGPTMKTLDEVEPRIPINAVNTPGDGNVEYKITSSGSYYLPENITTTKGGISVRSDDVKIDLMGYTLAGSDIMSGIGIVINDHNNIEISNGTIRDFLDGVSESVVSHNNRIIDVRVISNVRNGIYLVGHGGLVKNCVVSGNGSSANTEVYGIYVGKGSRVIDNTVHNNGVGVSVNVGNGVHGIHTTDGCTVTGNTVYSNGTSANAQARGIYASAGSKVTGNTVYHNGDSTIGGYDVHGIFVSWGCSVIGNNSYRNGTSASGNVYGIYLIRDCLADQNTAYDNGVGAGSATNMTLGVTGCVYGLNVVAP